MRPIKASLWFDGTAEDAATFYANLFDDAEVTGAQRYTEAGPGVPGSVVSVTWRIGDFNLSWTNDQSTSPNFDPLRPISTSPRVYFDVRIEANSVEAVPLTRRMAFVGRSLGCAVRFDATDVADVHAYLLMAGNEVWVIDLLSAPGTWVNDRRVRTARLRDGDEVRIGSRAFKVRYDLWGEVLPTEPPKEADSGTNPEPESVAVPPASEDEAADLVALTPVPVVPSLPTVAIPPQADANTVALFQYVAAMQGQMMAEFRQTMDETVDAIGRMHRQQMEAMRAELDRLAELSAELQKLQLPGPTPLTLPAPSPAAALYRSVPDPDEFPPSAQESTGRQQWVTSRLSEIEVERNGIWERIRGMFGKSNQAV